uniref:tail fiber domain-containing protein n=1 Tax=Citrobacter freundii TaxID=546 RepID=UPI0018920443|nr:tail fiber domain-containing protein [Citrobacter freundii]
MSAGTLTMTNNSAAVAGSGTAFTTELAAGDFIVVTVGGVPYTLPVKTINSNTSATLVSNFTGPTQSGSAWYAVPRIAMNLVTAAAVTQAAEALRGLNYDKQNWQSIFSDTGNVTVKLPDSTTWTGPAWGNVAKKGDNSDITSLSGLTTALSIKQGGTGGRMTDHAGEATFIAAPTNPDFNIFVQQSPTIGKMWGAYDKKNLAYIPLGVAQGGTGATTPGAARTALGVGTGDTPQFNSVLIQQGNYANLTIKNTNRELGDATAMIVLEVAAPANARAILSQRNLSNNNTGRVDATLPSTSGVIQVLGTSGRDYKESIAPADNGEAMARVMGLDLVNFVYKDDEQKRQRFGFIAEEAEKIAPQYVKHTDFAVAGSQIYDDKGELVSQEYRDRPGVDTNPIVMDLLGAVQYQQKMIKDMAESIKILESRLT